MVSWLLDGKAWWRLRRRRAAHLMGTGASGRESEERHSLL